MSSKNYLKYYLGDVSGKKLDNYFCKNINWRNKEFNSLLMEKSLNMSGNKTTKSYPWKKSGNTVPNLVHGKLKKRM